MHRDVQFTAAMCPAIDREIAGLGRWLRLHIEAESSDKYLS
jgi:hypothetical protein